MSTRIEGKANDLRAKCAELGLRVSERSVNPMCDASDLRVYRGDKFAGRLFWYWRSGIGYLEIYETVERAAIRVEDVTWSLPRPARHHDVLQAMPRDVAIESHIDDQGFVTSEGRFVSRSEAAQIARARGQLIREPTPADMLTSEDVW